MTRINILPPLIKLITIQLLNIGRFNLAIFYIINIIINKYNYV